MGKDIQPGGIESTNGNIKQKIEGLIKEKEIFDADQAKEASKVKAYTHKEAFCLMHYQCEKCDKIEILWNSRDGVTPFMVGCETCDGMMRHINWELDDCNPDYLPARGQRVFIDMTPEIHKILWRANVRVNWDRGQYPMNDRFKNPIEAVEALSGNFDPERREPYVLKL